MQPWNKGITFPSSQVSCPRTLGHLLHPIPGKECFRFIQLGEDAELKERVSLLLNPYLVSDSRLKRPGY